MGAKNGGVFGGHKKLHIGVFFFMMLFHVFFLACALWQTTPSRPLNDLDSIREALTKLELRVLIICIGLAIMSFFLGYAAFLQSNLIKQQDTKNGK